MPRRDLGALLLVTAAGLACSTQASAQALSCAVPARLFPQKAAGPSADEPVRQLPTASYTLALTWSPEYCRNKAGGGSFQCSGSGRFGLMLHGLWPDGAGRQWPQYCAPAKAVPEPVVRDMLCTTPSADLIQHEWAKHGTCGWTDPATYFARSKSLYGALTMPDMVALSRRQGLVVASLREQFLRVNRHIPGLTADSIQVQLTREGWLDEIWLCLDSNFAYTRCRDGQQGGRSAGQRVKIWRGALNPR